MDLKKYIYTLFVEFNLTGHKKITQREFEIALHTPYLVHTPCNPSSHYTTTGAHKRWLVSACKT